MTENAPPLLTRSDDGGLCTLTLNRPDKLNALNTALFAEIDAQLALLETQVESIGCVVLRGSGRGFCAGADLGAIGDGAAPPPTYKPRIIERLANLPQPVIAAVHGNCLTGGLELALAADFIVAAEATRFADTHGKWGLVGGWGMSQRLPRHIGLPAAKRMMMTGRFVGAAEALQMGLCDIVVPDAELDAAIVELTGQILANSWFTNVATKRLLIDTEGMTLRDGLAHEHYRFPGLAPDYKERIAAFSKK